LAFQVVIVVSPVAVVVVSQSEVLVVSPVALAFGFLVWTVEGVVEGIVGGKELRRKGKKGGGGRRGNSKLKYFHQLPSY
jgi:hypothetical protein